MTTRECYELIGGDYDEVMGRFRQDDRVRRFAKMFLQDPSYGELAKALEEGSTQDAFRAAHTLKGVCLNLGLHRLFESSNAATEALRGGDLEAARQLFPGVKEDYELCIDKIREL